jgi:hypothetical protein
MRIPANVLGYTTLRLAIGMSMFIHGVARTGHIPAFAETMTKQFSASVLPMSAVVVFAWATPPCRLDSDSMSPQLLAVRSSLIHHDLQPNRILDKTSTSSPAAVLSLPALSTRRFPYVKEQTIATIPRMPGPVQ